MSQVRETQRLPRSCTACSKRKIKCSKSIPCTACVRRGESHSCARELVRINGKFAIAVDANSPLSDDGHPFHSLEDENKGLLARIQHLEALLLQKENGTVLSSPIVLKSISEAEVCMPKDDILSTFQDLHVVSPLRSISQGRKNDNRSSDHLLSILPVRESSEKIVRHSLESLGWIHCALNAPRFIRKHEEFWNSLTPQSYHVLNDHAWMALYLSVLCVGVYFMEDDEVYQLQFLHEGYSGRAVDRSIQTAQRISWVLYSAVLQELENADFLGRPSLSTVQTLTVLSLVHQNFGQAEREYTLLGVAISTAKALSMDRLGREHTIMDREMTSTCWIDREDRELGRRLWWTLVICDWMIISSRSCSILPGSFSSALSLEEDQSHQDIVLGPFRNLDKAVSPLAYHLAVARIASIVHPYRNRDLDITTHNISKTLEELHDFSHTLPEHLTYNHDLPLSEGGEVSQVKTQQILILLLLDVCRVNLCLAALPIILDRGEDLQNFLWRGRNAAFNLVSQWNNENGSYFRKAWGPRAAILSAGIYLMLDLICLRMAKSASEIEEILGKVAFVLHILENDARHLDNGSRVLSHLVGVFKSWQVDRVVDKTCIFQIMASAAMTQRVVVGDRNETLEQQTASILDGEPFEVDGSYGMDLQFPLNLNDLAFDFFQPVSYATSDWSAGILQG